ncbi:MAG TPA: glycosyltransferase [Anaerolineales bacterium]|nr:glycosyltransferase [Anaerolineales bacterium]
MRIILFTTSYPYDLTAEYTFISPEIRRLAQRFEKIIVVPRINKGKRLPLPAGVGVNDEYADFLQKNAAPDKTVKRALASVGFLEEIRRHPNILLYPSKILKLILFSSRAELTRQWVKNLFQTQSIDVNNCILYSYWFDHTSTGCSLLKQEFPGVRLVSRAHGYDIYEKYYYPYYWPRRRETLDVLDAMFVASDAGREYFCEQYPEYRSKFETAHLGIEDPGFVSEQSEDGIFRIVTCSYIVPVKRLHLLLDGIVAAAQERPEQKFEWVHFGDGKGKKALERRIVRNLPSNVQSRFTGHVPNHEVLQHYRENPVDVFVNVSKTEGGAPVSIQEAISCGIPIIATSVGGNPEIVSEQNGILLSPDPEPGEIAAALLKLWDNPSLAARLRTGARQVWQTSYNADVNFRAFAERLQSIGESS